jgi:protein-disulfide isomerase
MNMFKKTKEKKGNISVAVAIIVAGLIIAGAVMFTNKSNAPTVGPDGQNPAADAASNVRPVDDSDWVYGNADAEITIVEYSDTECPFCSRLHPTLKQVVDESEGKVNWVYRHFPLVQLHPIAPTVAHATECVGELGGNDSFWNFTDRVYEEAAANGETDLSKLVEYAAEYGVDAEAYNQCMEESRHQAKVEGDFRNAVESGGTGTPYSIIISGEQAIPVEGALPIDRWRTAINALIQE